MDEETNKQADEQTDGQTDRRTCGRKNGRTDGRRTDDAVTWRHLHGGELSDGGRQKIRIDGILGLADPCMDAMDREEERYK